MLRQPSLILPPFLSRATRLAGFTLCALFLWSAFAKVDEAVKCNGRTISSDQNKIIQHLEGGIVSDILVQEGEMVESGQILFRVRNETTAATMTEDEMQLHGTEARILRLNAEIDGTPLVFPDDMQKSMPDVVRNEQGLYDSRRQQRAKNIDVIKNQVEEKKRTLEQEVTKVGNLQQELDTALKQYNMVNGLQQQGATSASRVLDAEARVDRSKTEIMNLKQTIPVTQSELKETQGHLEEAKAQMKNELLEEMQKAITESQQLTERLKGDKDKMVRTEVASPVKGVVNKLYLHTIGGTVRPGEVLAEITPLDDNIIVEAKLPPEYRAKIWTGQEVKVKITAYEYATYGTIPGVITDISADSFVDEQSHATFYRIKVALNKPKLDDNKKIMSGMITEVNILTGKRTILDYLLRPLIRVKDDAFREG